MSANEMNPKKTTSSFSKREKMRRNPFIRRNNRSISFRLLYISRPYSHGSVRLLGGGTTGVNPRSNANWAGLIALICPVHEQEGSWTLRAETGQQLAAFRRVVGLTRRERKGYSSSSIRGNHMNLGGPAPAGPADGLRHPFFGRASTVGMHLRDSAVQRYRLDLDAHNLFPLQVRVQTY